MARFGKAETAGRVFISDSVDRGEATREDSPEGELVEPNGVGANRSSGVVRDLPAFRL